MSFSPEDDKRPSERQAPFSEKRQRGAAARKSLGKNSARMGAFAGAFAGLMFVVSADQASADATTNGAARRSVVQQIEHYCSSSWRNSRVPLDDWNDCTQQVFLELLERMSQEQLDRAIEDPDSEERRELNRAIWRISKRANREVKPMPLNGYDIAEQTDQAQASEERRRQMQQVTRLAADQLGDRQSRIMELLLDGESVGNIARKLNTSPSRVSDAKYRAIKKIRDVLA